MTARRPVCAISLLVWNSVRYLENLLVNIAVYPPGGAYHLRILDQGSGPETAALLQRHAEGVDVVSVERLEANIGYGAGHNRNYARFRRDIAFDYFVTINDDLVFGETNWLDRLVEGMEARQDVAVGGPICFRMDAKTTRRSTRAERAAGRFDFVGGAVSIIRASAVDALGLFDEAYAPAYWEDADMCFRNRHFGWQLASIDLQVCHAYLGERSLADPAREAALARHGDFRRRNFALLRSRWPIGDRSPRLPPALDVAAAFPRLYFPGRPVAASPAC